MLEISIDSPLLTISNIDVDFTPPRFTHRRRLADFFPCSGKIMLTILVTHMAILAEILMCLPKWLV